jgi:hypothetical protein
LIDGVNTMGKILSMIGEQSKTTPQPARFTKFNQLGLDK